MTTNVLNQQWKTGRRRVISRDKGQGTRKT
jgi:hypothetical protein